MPQTVGFQVYEMSTVGKSRETGRKSVVARGWEWERMGCCSWDMISFRGNENALESVHILQG